MELKVRQILFCILFPSCLFSSMALANETEITQSIIIHNVTFVDPDGEKEDVVATLVIKNKLFDLITNDPIEVVKTDIVYDAQKG